MSSFRGAKTMASGSDISPLLALLYAAPLDDSKWNDFLLLLLETIDASSGALLSMAETPGQHSLCAYSSRSGDHEEGSRLYNEHYGQLDPFRDPFLSRHPNGIVFADSMVERKTFTRSEFYNDFLRHRDMEHAVMFSLAEPRHFEVLALWSSAHQGPLDRESLNLLNALAPHLRNALRLHAEMKVRARSASQSEAVLDGIASAAILLDPAGHVCLLNRAAVRILQQQDGLSVRNKRLRAPRPASHIRLSELIARAASMPGGSQGAVALCRPSGKPSLQALVSSVRLPGQAQNAPCHVLLLLSEAAQPHVPSAETLHALFGLSHAEIDIAHHLLEGQTLSQIAMARKVALGTVRMQMKSLLARTGACRQSDVIRLCMSLPQPFDASRT